jgi:hypothetical protein
MVPLLVLVAGLDQHEAAATSLCVIVPTALVASRVLAKRGIGDITRALALGSVGAVGASGGVLLALALPEDTLRVLFAVFLPRSASGCCATGCGRPRGAVSGSCPPRPAPPPAPWHSRIDAVLWWHRALPTASRELLPAELGRPLPVTLGGLIAYREGPVGPYGELFAAVGVLRGARVAGHVPFMAVDSAASVAGGRANWSLPKELAAFEGDPGPPGRVAARGEGWAVEAVARARPRALPAWAAAACAQVWPGGGRAHVRGDAARPRAAGLRGGRGGARVAARRVAAALAGIRRCSSPGCRSSGRRGRDATYSAGGRPGRSRRSQRKP